jgi:hypothetical protein
MEQLTACRRSTDLGGGDTADQRNARLIKMLPWPTLAVGGGRAVNA